MVIDIYGLTCFKSVKRNMWFIDKFILKDIIFYFDIKYKNVDVSLVVLFYWNWGEKMLL